MNELYEDARNLLLAQGWTKHAPSRFLKGDREVVFDTSTWVEVYEAGRGRIAEFKLQDFREEIAKLSS